MRNHLFSFGHGYSAQALARQLIPAGWRITGTTRNKERAHALRATGIDVLELPEDDPRPVLQSATHFLSSAAPGEDGDPAIGALRPMLGEIAPTLKWCGYLSTTGVYGDHGGGWVDEDTPLTPSTQRGKARVEAEREWRALAENDGLPLHIFRLAGIYGPRRGPFSKVREGTARRIIKAGQVFSRIHVDDIAQVLGSSIAHPDPVRVYNVCDDDPAPPEVVIAHAADLLNCPIPPAESWDTAKMTPMARSFYAESKRVRNDRIKEDLGVELLYPDYRSGLAALLAQET